MADILFHQNPVSTRERQRKPQTAKFVLVTVLVLVLVALGELGFHFLVRPELMISRVVVESEMSIPNQKLLQIAGLTGPHYFFSVDTAQVKRNLEAYAPVKSATVTKRFPNTLRVTLTGRKPLAMAFAQKDGHQVPLVFDEDGVVFEQGEDVSQWNLPVVSGLAFENPSPGVRLPRRLLAFLEDMKELSLKAPVLFHQISEYRIVQTGSQDFEVLLYPVNYHVPVRIGSQLDEEMCKYIVMVLDVFQRQKSLDTIQELDFRTGQVVFRMREDPVASR